MDTSPLFCHLIDEHDLILVDSELREIFHVVQNEEKYCGSCGRGKNTKHKSWCERINVN